MRPEDADVFIVGNYEIDPLLLVVAAPVVFFVAMTIWSCALTGWRAINGYRIR